MRPIKSSHAMRLHACPAILRPLPRNSSRVTRLLDIERGERVDRSWLTVPDLNAVDLDHRRHEGGGRVMNASRAASASATLKGRSSKLTPSRAASLARHGVSRRANVVAERLGRSRLSVEDKGGRRGPLGHATVLDHPCLIRAFQSWRPACPWPAPASRWI